MIDTERWHEARQTTLPPLSRSIVTFSARMTGAIVRALDATRPGSPAALDGVCVWNNGAQYVVAGTDARSLTVEVVPLDEGGALAPAADHYLVLPGDPLRRLLFRGVRWRTPETVLGWGGGSLWAIRGARHRGEAVGPSDEGLPLTERYPDWGGCLATSEVAWTGRVSVEALAEGLTRVMDATRLRPERRGERGFAGVRLTGLPEALIIEGGGGGIYARARVATDPDAEGDLIRTWVDGDLLLTAARGWASAPNTDGGVTISLPERRNDGGLEAMTVRAADGLTVVLALVPHLHEERLATAT